MSNISPNSDLKKLYNRYEDLSLDSDSEQSDDIQREDDDNHMQNWMPAEGTRKLKDERREVLQIIDSAFWYNEWSSYRISLGRQLI